MKKEIEVFAHKSEDGKWHAHENFGSKVHVKAILIIEEPETFESEADTIFTEHCVAFRNGIREPVIQAMKRLAQKYFGDKPKAGPHDY